MALDWFDRGEAASPRYEVAAYANRQRFIGRADTKPEARNALMMVLTQDADRVAASYRAAVDEVLGDHRAFKG